MQVFTVLWENSNLIYSIHIHLASTLCQVLLYYCFCYPPFLLLPPAQVLDMPCRGVLSPPQTHPESPPQQVQ